MHVCTAFAAFNSDFLSSGFYRNPLVYFDISRGLIFRHPSYSHLSLNLFFSKNPIKVPTHEVLLLILDVQAAVNQSLELHLH